MTTHGLPETADPRLPRSASRADYSDPFYRALGKEAISEWRTNPLWIPYFHETGVLFHSGEENPAAAEYIAHGIQHASTAEDEKLERAAEGKSLPRKAYEVVASDQEKAWFPKALRKHLGEFADKLGSQYPSYYNPRGGWAEAREATVAALKEAQRLGAQVVGSAEVCQLIYEGKRAQGVVTRDGRSFKTENDGAVIICAGAWTPKLAASLLPPESAAALQEPSIASGQTVITVQLDKETAKDFKGTPVIFDLKTGFYTFEPDSNGVLKGAIHDAGYTHPQPAFGVPAASITYPSFTSSSSSTDIPHGSAEKSHLARQDTMGGRNTGAQIDVARKPQRHIPPGFENQMFQYLVDRFPTLRTKSSNLQTRVCHYSDTEDENWVIDHAPGPVDNVILATGDSGHGFKFLPTIGEYIAARLPRSIRPTGVRDLTDYQARVWSIQHHLKLQAETKARQRHQDAQSGNARARL